MDTLGAKQASCPSNFPHAAADIEAETGTVSPLASSIGQVESLLPVVLQSLACAFVQFTYRGCHIRLRVFLVGVTYYTAQREVWQDISRAEDE